MNAGGIPVDAAPSAPGEQGVRGGGAAAPGAEVGPGTDAVLTGLRRHARHLVAELPGPLRRVRLRGGDTVLEVEWHAVSAGPAPAGAADAVPPASPPAAPPPDRYAVRSPMVGTFHRAPEPGAAPFVAVGDPVRPGQVVGIVEAMKLMNEVTAERGGRVAEVLAADGQPVEYDQPLVALDPD
ncbi:acetyl-CoA carboxylase biotin carboxyl carrier protein subunit [Micromonospora sp. C31]|uniref:acetyl-CoA carboxylase biotin carboxyl carrier protein n=1 Tax=Micromonospora sp. C31 TaxID=2824876 RepID=UPI001B39AD42|nr:biotin/lipoyl-containing protein [Micromonospora sp. C31]MBQ1074370.1 acetyl-CoA carboxylase biotin carboxyl carrier protein subunit [Micromonospora sp. C31]